MTGLELSEFVSWFLHQAKCDAPLTLSTILLSLKLLGEQVLLSFNVFNFWFYGPILCCIWNFLFVCLRCWYLTLLLLFLWDRQILLFPVSFSKYLSEKWWILSCLSTAVKYLYEVCLWCGQYTCRNPSSQQKNTLFNLNQVLNQSCLANVGSCVDFLLDIAYASFSFSWIKEKRNWFQLN